MEHLAVVLLWGAFILGSFGAAVNSEIQELDAQLETHDLAPRILMAKGIQPAPLSPDANVEHAVELVTGLVGMLGNAAGGLAYELTGINLHDCSQDFKDLDLSVISCDEFLDVLSKCPSLGRLQSQLRSAKVSYRKIKGKSVGSGGPCASS